MRMIVIPSALFLVIAIAVAWRFFIRGYLSVDGARRRAQEAMKAGDLAGAETLLLNAYAIAQEHPHAGALSLAAHELANFYLHTESVDRAERYANEAVQSLERRNRLTRRLLPGA